MMRLSSIGWKPSLPFVTVRRPRRAMTPTKSRRTRKSLLPSRSRPAHPRPSQGLGHRETVPRRQRRQRARRQRRRNKPPPPGGGGKEKLRRSKLLAYSGEMRKKLSHPGPMARVGSASESTFLTHRGVKLLGSLQHSLSVPFDHNRCSRERRRESHEQRNAAHDCFYYNARSSHVIELDKLTRVRIQEDLPPGFVRTQSGSVTVLKSQISATKKLPETAWPAIMGRPAWPSSPTITEWLEMLRRGAKRSSELFVERGKTLRSTIREFNSNIELAKRVVHRQIIGVRADVSIPSKYLGCFRYRWGFLILTAPYLPAGLARFLASLWCTNPYSLWLERKVTLKQYLRALPLSIFNRTAASGLPKTPCVLGTEPRSFTDSADEYSESYSGNSSELD